MGDENGYLGTSFDCKTVFQCVIVLAIIISEKKIYDMNNINETTLKITEMVVGVFKNKLLPGVGFYRAAMVFGSVLHV